MSDIIVIEHFTLGSERKEHLVKCIEKIQLFLTPDSKVEAAIRHDAYGVFTAQFKGRVYGKAMLAHSSSRNFYAAVNDAKAQILRQIRERRQKALSNLRRSHADKSVFVRHLRLISKEQVSSNEFQKVG